MKRWGLLVPIAVATLVSQNAWGEPWVETFKAAGPMLIGQDESVLVVAAGPASADLEDATDAILQVARARASLAMDSSVLGSVEALDDASIVKLAKHFPVKRIVVVRLFPSEGEGIAVVSVYHKEGESILSFSARSGVPAFRPGDGVPVEAVESVEAVAEQSYWRQRVARDDYDRLYLRVGGPIGGRGRAETFAVFRGSRGVELEGAQFYETIGRLDLAQEYRSRRGKKASMKGIGGVLLVVGALWPLVEIGLETCTVQTYDYGFESWEEEICEYNIARSLLVSGALVTAGSALVAAGVAMDPHPVSGARAGELVDDFNARLRQKLQLTFGPGVSAGARVAFWPGGGGLLIRGQY